MFCLVAAKPMEKKRKFWNSFFSCFGFPRNERMDWTELHMSN